MAYDFKAFKQKIAETQDWLKGELASIQTGRATAMMLDSIRVDSYGSKMPINQVASITTEDARTLRIVPWDTDMIQTIESAIRDGDLGLGVSVDDQGLRVSFPELTTETRDRYVKLVHAKREEARVSVRGARDDVWNDIQRQEKSGDISEDEKFTYKEEMEKITKEGNEELEAISSRKETEIKG